jgi:hypothetical protein
MASDEEVSPIEHMVIFHRCKLDQLITLVSYTPQLVLLYCSNVEEAEDELESDMSMTFANLKHLGMQICFVSFVQFERFLLSLCSPLEALNIHVIYADENYIDFDQWERIMSHHMPLLKKFHFCYPNFIEEDSEINFISH